TFIPSIQDASFMIIQVAWCRPYRASVPVVVLSYKDFVPTGLPYAPGSSQTKVIISLYLVVQDASPLLLKDCAPAADSAWLRRSLTFVGIVAQRNRQPRRGGTFI